MPAREFTFALEQFTNFGDLLKYLRRRTGLTQRELSIAVGYSHAQISRLELNQRQPDLATITARFVPALDLEDEPEVAARLLELAASTSQRESPVPGAAPYKGLQYFDEADSRLFLGAKPWQRAWSNVCGPWRPLLQQCVFWLWLVRLAAANRPWCGRGWSRRCGRAHPLTAGNLCAWYPPPDRCKPSLQFSPHPTSR
jgi:DNA-binding XRE family transcriptional regulator